MLNLLWDATVAFGGLMYSLFFWPVVIIIGIALGAQLTGIIIRKFKGK